MGSAVCLNVNVLLRTFFRTLGTIYFMMNISWKLTFLMLMETPVTCLIQNVYNTHYEVKSGEEVTSQSFTGSKPNQAKLHLKLTKRHEISSLLFVTTLHDWCPLTDNHHKFNSVRTNMKKMIPSSAAVRRSAGLCG